MKIGDLIKIKDSEAGLNINGVRDTRRHGIVHRLDVYGGTESLRPLRVPEPIAEVLWNDGSTGWIATNRVEVIGC